MSICTMPSEMTLPPLLVKCSNSYRVYLALLLQKNPLKELANKTFARLSIHCWQFLPLDPENQILQFSGSKGRKSSVHPVSVMIGTFSKQSENWEHRQWEKYNSVNSRYIYKKFEISWRRYACMDLQYVVLSPELSYDSIQGKERKKKEVLLCAKTIPFFFFFHP